MDTNTNCLRDGAQEFITRQENTAFMALGRDETEAIIGRQTSMLALESKNILYPFWRKIISLHTSLIKDLPFPIRYAQNLKDTDWQRDDKAIG